MKKTRKWNVVDAVVILAIAAAVVLFAVKLIRGEPGKSEEEKEPVPGIIRYEVEVPGMTRELYEEVASFIPCQMAASGKWLEGHIVSVSWEPCDVQYIEVSSPVNSNETQWIKADPDTEYVTGVFQCEAEIDLSGMFNMVGTQEIRVGRSHYVKGMDIELIGTIRKMSKSAS